MKPVTQYVLESIIDGELPESFSLDDYRNQTATLAFSDGAQDGITFFHTNMTSDQFLISYLVKLFSTDCKYKKGERVKLINEYLSSSDIHILSSIDELRAQLSDDHKIDREMVFQIAYELVMASEHIEAVKLGLSLLDLFYHYEQVAGLVETVLLLALCEEFTLYINTFLIDSLKDPNKIRFRLARHTKGWGKIFLVRSLENDSPEINKWLLEEGFENDVSSGYLANNIVEKTDYLSYITNCNDEHSFHNICQVISGLVFEGFYFDHPHIELIEAFVELYDTFKDNREYYLTVYPVLLWCNDFGHQDLEEMILYYLSNEYAENKLREFFRKSEETIETMDLINLAKKIDLDISEAAMEKLKKDPIRNAVVIDYLMDNGFLEEVIELLDEPVDLSGITGQVENIFNYHPIEGVLRAIEEYPYVGEQYVVAALKCRYMNIRSYGLGVIENWLSLEGVPYYDLSEEIVEALNWLHEHETVKANREKLDDIMDIEEDLSMYDDGISWVS